MRFEVLEMADTRPPDVNTDRNGSRTLTEDATRRAQRSGVPERPEKDRENALEPHSRSNERERWPHEDGNLEKSSGHP
jgi:hypothetical protein